MDIIRMRGACWMVPLTVKVVVLEYSQLHKKT